MNRKNIEIYFDDILECIDKIFEYTENISEKRFRKDTQIQDAVIRRIEIIGEASNSIPKDIQKNIKICPGKTLLV